MNHVRWCAAAALVVSTLAGAQVAAPAPEWATGADFGLNAARGNSSFTTMSAGFRLTHVNRQQFELDWSSLLTYGESNVAVIARRVLTGFKVDYRPTATWSPFVFATVERDVIRRLDMLSNVGAGVKWTYHRNTAGAFSVSAAAIHSHKDLNGTPSVATDPRLTTARLSLRPKVTQRFASGFSFEQTSFYQPAFDEFADYMIDATTRVGYVLSKSVSVFAQHIYRFDSRPPLGVKREDQLLVSGVKIQR